MSVKQYCFGKIFYNFNEFSVLSSTPSRFDTHIVAKPDFSVNLTVFLTAIFCQQNMHATNALSHKILDFENNLQSNIA